VNGMGRSCLTGKTYLGGRRWFDIGAGLGGLSLPSAVAFNVGYGGVVGGVPGKEFVVVRVAAVRPLG
jgi:hypothetical protein